MTDKQIIDDCIHLDEWKHCDICEKLIKTKDGANGKKREHLLTEEDLRCDFYPNCYYKQLKAKEQECERLKKWLPIVTRLENEFENFEKAKAIDYKSYIEQIFIELDKLKAENDNIKETFDGLFKVQYKLADNNKKLRQCLTEIKEIAETCCINQATLDCENYDDCTQCGRTSDGEGIQQILQKISECEGNDGN